MDQITAKLTHIEGLAEALERAFGELEALAVAEGETYAPLVGAIGIRRRNLQGVIDKPGAAGLRGVLAEIRRPKGRKVMMEWVARLAEPDAEREVIRRTDTRALLRDPYGGMEWYQLSTGEQVGAKKSYSSGQIRGYRTNIDRWRIRKDEIEKIRALPVGHNDVSRAVEKAQDHGEG